MRVVAVVSEAATTMPKASPLSQPRSASRVWVLRAASMSQEVMSGFWPVGGRSMRVGLDGHEFTARGHAGDAEADAGEPGGPREETQERHAVAHQVDGEVAFPVASMLKDLPKESWPMRSKEK